MTRWVSSTYFIHEQDSTCLINAVIAVHSARVTASIADLSMHARCCIGMSTNKQGTITRECGFLRMDYLCDLEFGVCFDHFATQTLAKRHVNDPLIALWL